MAGTSARIGIVVAAAACLWSSASLAQQADSLLKSGMKMLGFATDVAPPADFVLQSRPKGDLDYVPIFQPPPEPAKPALNDKELKALKGDLDSVQKRDDAIRQAFPPAVKAAAEDAAAKKAKAKPATANQ
ncbi:MAG TPA: hypothetical protein VJY34_17130 [Roseiarcus sp.]|nr:hypothetical protein [Roseiarcus sp.]